MYQNTITLFNFHEATGLWYPSVFTGVDLGVNNSSRSTKDGKNNGDAVSVIIPMQVGEKYVTGIADYAFKACASLISVHLPDFDDEAYLNGYEFDTLGEYAFPAWISTTASAAGTERTDQIC